MFYYEQLKKTLHCLEENGYSLEYAEIENTLNEFCSRMNEYQQFKQADLNAIYKMYKKYNQICLENGYLEGAA